MISYLRGVLLDKHPNQIVVDVNGVGYELTIPVSTFSVLPNIGNEVHLRVHTHVREDALALFGFGTSTEKAVFEKLIGVSGIGPKLAVTVLSGLDAKELVAAIRGGQVEALVRIPGVGKKTAERMIVELRDKLDMLGIAAAAVSAGPAKMGKPAFTQEEEDAISALMNFGAQRAAAEAAVSKAKAEAPGESFEVLFRRALKLLR
jgi:Holliday junction DNA helicase RuvA